MATPSNISRHHRSSFQSNYNPSTNSTRYRSPSRDRLVKCPICFNRHAPDRCYARGASNHPIWLRRNVAKYNAVHKDDIPSEEYINQSAPLRKAQANECLQFDREDEIISDTESDSTIYHDTEETHDSFHDPSYVLQSPTYNMINDHTHTPTVGVPPHDEDDESFVEC